MSCLLRKPLQDLLYLKGIVKVRRVVSCFDYVIVLLFLLNYFPTEGRLLRPIL